MLDLSSPISPIYQTPFFDNHIDVINSDTHPIKNNKIHNIMINSLLSLLLILFLLYFYSVYNTS